MQLNQKQALIFRAVQSVPLALFSIPGLNATALNLQDPATIQTVQNNTNIPPTDSSDKQSPLPLNSSHGASDALLPEEEWVQWIDRNKGQDSGDYISALLTLSRECLKQGDYGRAESTIQVLIEARERLLSNSFSGFNQEAFRQGYEVAVEQVKLNAARQKYPEPSPFQQWLNACEAHRTLPLDWKVELFVAAIDTHCQSAERHHRDRFVDVLQGLLDSLPSKQLSDFAFNVKIRLNLEVCEGYLAEAKKEPTLALLARLDRDLRSKILSAPSESASLAYALYAAVLYDLGFPFAKQARKAIGFKDPAEPFEPSHLEAARLRIIAEVENRNPPLALAYSEYYLKLVLRVAQNDERVIFPVLRDHASLLASTGTPNKALLAYAQLLTRMATSRSFLQNENCVRAFRSVSHDYFTASVSIKDFSSAISPLKPLLQSLHLPNISKALVRLLAAELIHHYANAKGASAVIVSDVIPLLDESEKQGATLKTICFEVLSVIQRSSGKLDEAIVYAIRAIDVSKKVNALTPLPAKVIPRVELLSMFVENSQFMDAQELLHEGLSEQMASLPPGYEQWQASFKQSLGLLACQQKLVAESRMLFKQAASLWREFGDLHNLAKDLVRIGQTYADEAQNLEQDSERLFLSLIRKSYFYFKKAEVLFRHMGEDYKDSSSEVQLAMLSLARSVLKFGESDLESYGRYVPFWQKEVRRLSTNLRAKKFDLDASEPD